MTESKNISEEWIPRLEGWNNLRIPISRLSDFMILKEKMKLKAPLALYIIREERNAIS